MVDSFGSPDRAARKPREHPASFEGASGGDVRATRASPYEAATRAVSGARNGTNSAVLTVPRPPSYGVVTVSASAGWS